MKSNQEPTIWRPWNEKVTHFDDYCKAEYAVHLGADLDEKQIQTMEDYVKADTTKREEKAAEMSVLVDGYVKKQSNILMNNVVIPELIRRRVEKMMAMQRPDYIYPWRWSDEQRKMYEEQQRKKEEERKQKEEAKRQKEAAQNGQGCFVGSGSIFDLLAKYA